MGRQKKIEPLSGGAKLYVDMDRICHHSEYSSEEYGNWSESYSTSINGVTLDSGGGWMESIPLDFEAKSGDTIYLIWCVYSTGDSFGCSSGGSNDVIIAYKTKEKADAALEVLEGAGKDKNGSYIWSVPLISESGAVVPYCRPWLGYFENLDSLNVDSFVIA